MNHKNYYAYRMSKRKIIVVKNFENIFEQLEDAKKILKEQTEVSFVDETGKILIRLKSEGGWTVTVESFDEALERWEIIKSHLGYVRSIFFVDSNKNLLAYTHDCWLVH